LLSYNHVVLYARRHYLMALDKYKGEG